MSVANLPSPDKMQERTEKRVESSFSLSPCTFVAGSTDDKNNYIMKHAQATAMRQYSQWVSVINVGGKPITRREMIETLLGDLSADPVSNKVFMEKINKFINDGIVSLIGIPAYNCTKCDKPQDPEVTLKHFTNVIPIDIIPLFTTLLGHVIGQVVTR